MNTKYDKWYPRNPKGRADSDKLPELTPSAARKQAIVNAEEAARESRSSRIKGVVEDPTKDTDSDKNKDEDKDTPLDKVIEDPRVDDLEDKDTPVPEEPKKDQEEDDDSFFEDFSDDDDTPTKEEDDTGILSVDDDGIDDSLEDKDKISAWRARVQEQGSLRKEAEAKVIELEAERDEIAEKLREAENQTKTLSQQNINWHQHDSVIPLWDQFDTNVQKGALQISTEEERNAFMNDIQGELLTEYYTSTKEAKTVQDKVNADAKFRTVLEDRYHVDNATSLIAILKDSLKIRLDIEDTVDSLKDKHSTNSLSMGAEEYDARMGVLKPVLDDLGNMDADYIENNPNAIESIISKRYQSDEEFKKKADKFKSKASQFFTGLQPLNQAQLDRAQRVSESKGVDLKDYLKQREVNFEKAKVKFFNDNFYNAMAMDDFEERDKVYARYLAAKAKKKSTNSVISKAKPSSPDKPIEPVDKRPRNITPRGTPTDYVPVTQRKSK